MLHCLTTFLWHGDSSRSMPTRTSVTRSSSTNQPFCKCFSPELDQIRFGECAARSRRLKGPLVLPLQRDRERPTVTVRVDVAHIEAVDRYFVKPDTAGAIRQAEHLLGAPDPGHNNGGDR